MFKVFLLFLVTSFIGFFTIWLKNEPGYISISWYGWLIEMSMPILILRFILIFLFLSFKLFFIKKIYFLPKKIKYQINNKRNSTAMKNIINAYSAKGMEEIELAKYYSNKAKRLNKSPLKLLLDMEINKSYDEYEKNIFIEMMKYPETKLLAIKTITNNYLKENDILKALSTINLIPKSKKTPNWFFYKLLKLNILNNDWDNILLSVDYINKYTNISSKEYKQLKGQIYYSKAIYLFENNNFTEALKNVDTSLKFIPSFSSSIVLRSKIIYDDSPKEAIKYIKDSWKKFSHPDIINLINEINFNKNKSYILKLVKDIIKNGRNSYNNNLLLASASINANSWKTASKHFKTFLVKNGQKILLL